MIRHPLILTATILIALLLASVSPTGAALLLNEMQSANIDSYADEDGDHEDWIEILNTGPGSVDLLGYGLSDDPAVPLRWTFPSLVLAEGERVIVFASGKNRTGSTLHTNFSISAEGETILLSDAAAGLLDFISGIFVPAGISLGRSPDGGIPGYYFELPTPLAINDSPAFAGIADPPEISPPGGYFSGVVGAMITDPGGQATATTWTLGGWDPGVDSTAYSTPIVIMESTVLRARNFEPGKLPSPIVTATYLLDEEIALPSVSVVTDPDNLWDEQIGIYVFGDDYNPSYPYEGANFWQNWERPAHIEYFDTAGQTLASLDLGIKIHGNMSRLKPQKSLRLMIRSGYGAGALESPLFGSAAPPSFRRLILRNAGNDWCITHMRDAFAQSTVSHLDLDCQAWQPTVIWLNGEYWGIQNLRERQDVHYLASHYDVDPDAVDILVAQGTAYDIIEGDNQHYEDLVDFFVAGDLTDPANFDYVQTQMETDNFALYNITEVFFGNMDWPRNNRRYWRPQSPDGRWRWFIYDLDYSQGLAEDVDFDNLAYATAEVGGNQNPLWSTLMLRKLLENDTFRRDFINSYADLLNTAFSPTSLENRLALARERVEPEMERHMVRWDSSWLTWDYRYQAYLEFLQERPAYAREHLQLKFALPDTLTLTLAMDPPAAGSIALTAIEVDTIFSGVYFQGNPIPLRARAANGFEFAGWSDPQLPQVPEIVITPDQATHLVAMFTASIDSAYLVINEINYHSAYDFDPGDWVELHNPTQSSLDISGWEFRDESDAHFYDIPTGTVIEAGGFLVLCDNTAAFTALFPEVDNYLGDLGFGFSGGGELLRLFDNLGELHDSVLYDDSPPWPTEPDGTGPTLELIHPVRDNGSPGSWGASSAPWLHGTPGTLNSIFDETATPAMTPMALRLAAPWPNPFNPTTHLQFDLPRPGPVNLVIFDLAGRKTRTLIADTAMAAGSHEIRWHGRDDHDRPLPSGIYFVRLQTEGGTFSRKLTLLK